MIARAERAAGLHAVLKAHDKTGVLLWWQQDL